MTHRNDIRAKEIAKELLADSLPGVLAEFDDTDTCYLSGTADTPDGQAHAVEIANAHGAVLVIEGIDVPGQELPHLNRRHFVEGHETVPTHADTPAGRILGAANLSNRVFDSHHDSHAGTLIASNTET